MIPRKQSSKDYFNGRLDKATWKETYMWCKEYYVRSLCPLINNKNLDFIHWRMSCTHGLSTGKYNKSG